MNARSIRMATVFIFPRSIPKSAALRPKGYLNGSRTKAPHAILGCTPPLFASPLLQRRLFSSRISLMHEYRTIQRPRAATNFRLASVSAVSSALLCWSKVAKAISCEGAKIESRNSTETGLRL